MPFSGLVWIQLASGTPPGFCGENTRRTSRLQSPSGDWAGADANHTGNKAENQSFSITPTAGSANDRPGGTWR